MPICCFNESKQYIFHPHAGLPGNVFFSFFFFFSVPTHAQTFFSSGGFRGSMSKTLDYCTIGLDRAKSSNKGNQEQGYGLHHFKENQGLFLHHGSIQREIDLAVSQRDEWMSAERMQE